MICSVRETYKQMDIMYYANIFSATWERHRSTFAADYNKRMSEVGRNDCLKTRNKRLYSSKMQSKSNMNSWNYKRVLSKLRCKWNVKHLYSRRKRMRTMTEKCKLEKSVRPSRRGQRIWWTIPTRVIINSNRVWQEHPLRCKKGVRYHQQKGRQ